MTAYNAPLADMRFVLREIADLESIAALPGYEEATPDLVDAALEEAGKLAAEVLAPLNQVGDRQGSQLENGVVRTPDGFRDAYRLYVDGGWNALPFDPAYGGQGLPWALATAVQEMWHAANMSFGLCPLLTQGAVDLLQSHGTEQQKALYLPKMIPGDWAGTMNLTEPQAGSDVGAAKTLAVPNGDHYRISGQKVFITYGEHDLTENIVHMVLARIPGAPPGSKGLSLFVVPKYLVESDGALGQRNDLRCASIEHKLGIHASPTTVMLFGENEGAVGYLIGEENHGMACMFTMMNNARLSVGVQGLAIAERAYQQALAFAQERLQGRALESHDKESVPIIRHPDVRRMLMTMKAKIAAMRALAYYVAAALDRAKRHPDPTERARNQALVDLLTPVTKGWLSETGCELTSLGVQIHGGMGFIEETGAAQYFRDARIAPIYEGSNGIQAMDLMFRKLARDDGRAASEHLATMQTALQGLADVPGDRLDSVRDNMDESLQAVEAATRWTLDNVTDSPARAAAGASPLLRLYGLVTGGWLLAQSAAAASHALASSGNGAAEATDSQFLESKVAVACFYAENLLPEAAALAAAVTRGSQSTLALEDSQF